MKTISIYDTTLRDGSQSEDVSFTVEDKIRISHKLDELGIKYELAEFYNNMPENYKKAQLVISRAGASTIAELSTIGWYLSRTVCK